MTVTYMTIGELPEATGKTNGDYVEIFQGNKSFKIKITDLARSIADLTEASAKTDNDYLEILQGGVPLKIKLSELVKTSSYTLGVSTSTQLDNANNVFTIDNTASTTKHINLPVTLPAGHALTMVIVVRGKVGPVIWDANIHWDGGISPELATNVTVVVLLWDGTAVHGSQSTSY